MGEPGKCWESGWVGCGVRKSGLVTLSLDPQKQCGQIPFSVWVSVSSFGKRIERNQFGIFCPQILILCSATFMCVKIGEREL